MSIRAAVFHEAILGLNITGALAAGASKAVAVVPFAGRLARIFAKVRAAGTKPGDATTNVVLDVNKNGTSIASGTVATFDGSATSPTYGTGVTGDIIVAEGDILTLDVDTVFNGTGPTQPSDLVVAIVLERYWAFGVSTGAIDGKV